MACELTVRQMNLNHPPHSDIGSCSEVLQDVVGAGDRDRRRLALLPDLLHDTILHDGGVAVGAEVAKQTGGVESHAS